MVESKTMKTHQEIRRKHRVLEIIPVERDPQEGGLRKKTGIFLDEVVDVVLRHEMRDVVLAVGYLCAVRQSAPDVVLQGRGLRCSSGEVKSLCGFDLNGFFWAGCREWLKEICYGINMCTALGV
jgi:hypothetical protein